LKYLINLISVIVIIFTLIKETPTMQELQATDTILTFGDSLTFGYGAKRNESYPSVLATLIHSKVINGGVNGDTSSEGLKRLPKLLEDKSIKLIILCFGGNDILRKLPMSELKDNLRNMANMAKAKNIKVLLVSVPNIGLFGLSPLDLYEDLSVEENVPLASGVLSGILSKGSLKSDQIHPNALGYKKMAKDIYNVLKKYGWVQ